MLITPSLALPVKGERMNSRGAECLVNSGNELE